jgi:hypothetical protein
MLLDWPIRSPDGRPVTTATNQAIWKAFVLHEPAFVERMDQCGPVPHHQYQNWRHDYPALVEMAVRLAVTASHERLLEMYRAGLQAAHESMVVRSDDGVVVQTPLQAMAEAAAGTRLPTKIYVGSQPVDPNTSYPFRLASPLARVDSAGITRNDINEEPTTTSIRGRRRLSVVAAVSQLQAWQTYGCLEPSAAARAAAVVTAPDARPMVAHRIFCLLGITSELGPARELLRIPGAHVMGVARAGSKLQRLVDFCQQQAHTSTILQVPEPGADLLTDFAAIAEWILACASANDDTSRKQLVLCPTAYLDGEANVRATVAMDLIVDYILHRHRNVALSYLTSPATVYTIPRAAAAHA